MEYAPINLPRPAQRPLACRSSSRSAPTTTGPSSTRYKPHRTPSDEAAELQRIAARSDEPQLAYGTDEDNFLGIDPESLQFDLGNDPIAFAAKRIDIARDLFARQETRELKPSEDYSRAAPLGELRAARRRPRRRRRWRARSAACARCATSPAAAAIRCMPVPAAKQREALDLLAARRAGGRRLRAVAGAAARAWRPTSRSAPTRFGGDGPVGTDFSLAAAACSSMQRALLGQLMSDGVAARMLDSEAKADEAGRTHSACPSCIGRLTREVWSELGASGDIPAPRRELQREHVNRSAATAAAARRRRAAPTRAACCARRRSAAAAASRQRPAGRGCRPRRGPTWRTAPTR